MKIKKKVVQTTGLWEERSSDRGGTAEIDGKDVGAQKAKKKRGLKGGRGGRC